VTHLGQRLSALIDGELEGSERERVLVHMGKCGSCRDEVAALRMLKRRMNALGEQAAGAGLTGPAGAGLTGRLMSLRELMGLDDSRLSGSMPSGDTIWPPPPPAGGWPMHGRPATPDQPSQPGLPPQPGQPPQRGQPPHPGQAAKPADRDGRPDQRAGRYFLAGSLVIFLAGLGTAAVIAGGEPQAQAPAPPVTPSIDVIVAPHIAANLTPTAGTGATFLRSPTDQLWWRPDVEATSLPGRP
jgi:hypothetical protein